MGLLTPDAERVLVLEMQHYLNAPDDYLPEELEKLRAELLRSPLHEWPTERLWCFARLLWRIREARLARQAGAKAE